MNKINHFSFLIVVVIFLTSTLSCTTGKDELLNKRIKIALRNVGNELLHLNNDSTSLVLPIVEIDRIKYRMKFQNKIAIQPEKLDELMRDSFKKETLPKNYIVEVLDCNGNEVAYSYEAKNDKENNIIPCRGRNLDKNCYSLEITVIKETNDLKSKYLIYFLPLLIFMGFFLFKRKSKSVIPKTKEDFIKIGSFHFYDEQCKLMIKKEEIKLTKKECELLLLFIKKPNMVIKRDEIEKQVWEDNGVFVGRSLDIYISKLRKKLEADPTVKLINIHSVGYKLEIQ